MRNWALFKARQVAEKSEPSAFLALKPASEDFIHFHLR
jgi:hypothetical protein